MRNQREWCLTLAVLLSLTASLGVAGEAQDKEAIGKIGAAYVQVFQTGDAKALAAFWTIDGDFTDCSGKFLKGRDAIENYFTRVFKTHKGLKLSIKSAALRFATAEVAIEDGTCEARAADDTFTSRVRYTSVHLKKDGKWLISSVREAPFIPPTNYEHLKEFQPMIGTWVGEGEHGETEELSISWADNQNFVAATFSRTAKGLSVGSEHQLIAWDPIKKNVRSWIFDAAGGFGEGSWSGDATNWTIKTTSVHRDGKKLSDTRSIVSDGDSMTLKSSGQTVDGKMVEEVREIKLKRVQ